jgi:hypothetical protein
MMSENKKLADSEYQILHFGFTVDEIQESCEYFLFKQIKIFGAFTLVSI